MTRCHLLSGEPAAFDNEWTFLPAERTWSSKAELALQRQDA